MHLNVFDFVVWNLSKNSRTCTNFHSPLLPDLPSLICVLFSLDLKNTVPAAHLPLLIPPFFFPDLREPVGSSVL